MATTPPSDAPQTIQAESEMDHYIRSRHSSRAFHEDRPVPRRVLDEALALAQTSPSNSNIQPWRMWLVSGEARRRLGAALVEAAGKGTPAIPPLPEPYRHYRSELGLQIYGKGMQIAREDRQGRAAAVLRNFDFFGAPCAGVLCLDEQLGSWDAMSVGMYLQTFLLALTERGVGTCVEVSVAGYPDVLHQELGIDKNLKVLCGIAIGYADENLGVNHLEYTRDAVAKCVTFVE